MIKSKKYICCMVFIATVLFLWSSNLYAQVWFREWVRGRIKQKAKERRQAQGTLQYGPGDYDFSLVHGGITRAYKVHLPPNYDETVKTPVVVYLHGGGGSMKAAYKDGVDKASDKFGFILAVPAGTGVLRDRLLTWNSGKWPARAGGFETESCCGYAAENNIDDAEFISKMIDEIRENFNVDEKRIYATGISNGGMMSYRLACELSDKIAAIAPVAPPAIPMDCSPSRSVPLMHIHGTADPCAPYQGGTGGGCLGSKKYQMQSAKDMVNTWMKMNGCSRNSITTYKKGKAVCVSYRECRDNSEVEFCTVEGMGHTYPCGSQYLSPDKIGPASCDMTFDQIWEFFTKHPMPDTDRK